MLKALIGRLLGRPALPDRLSYEAAREALERHSARLHRDLAAREGVRPLRISGALKVAQGVTSLDEIVKVAPPADEK